MTAAGVEPIAIVGMAVHLPGAPDLDAYWRNVVDGVDATSEVPADRWDPHFFDPDSDRPDRFYCRRGGFLDAPTFDAAGFGIMPVAAADAEPDQLLALQVARDAAADAGGVGPDRVDPERVGVVLGRGGYLTPGMARLDQRVRVANQLTSVLREVAPELPADRLDEVEAAFLARLGPARPEAAIGLVPNLAASRIANRLDLQGPAFTVDAACASSLLAVEQSVAALRSGRCDVMLAGGVHHCHDLTFWSVFSQLGALSRRQQIRPFDKGADGLLIGEGTAVVVLKRLADAERDGDRVYAVVRGVGSSSDGRASSLMTPRVSGQVLALRRAWADAGLDPATVGLVEAHGTATAAGDAAELATLAEVFGPADDRPRAGLGSVKSMIGHTMPAAGAAGLVKAALALYHATLPPTLHCDDPHDALAATRFRPVTEAEPWPDAAPRRAAVNAFGFGGINAHVVLGEWPEIRPSNRARVAGPALPDVPRRVELPAVLRLAAPSPTALAAALDRPDGDLLEAARRRVDPAAGAGAAAGSVRLALVDPTPERLALARKVVARGRPWRGRSDLWFTADPLLGSGGGRLAFCHPGVEPVFEHDTADLTDHFGLPRVEDGAESMGRRVAAIVALGRTLHQALDIVGVRPDLVFGHSVGEWTGMNTAGHIPPQQADRFAASIDIDRVTVPDAWYVALGCSAGDAASLVEGLDDVVLTHDNCPRQSMVCGTAAAVEQVLARARDRRILAQKLPFRSGFHSPLLADHLAELLANLDRVPLQDPHTPLWSSTTRAPYPADPDGVRRLAARHLVEPVRFGPLVQHLHDHEGVRAVVQVGNGSLVGFVEDALRGRDVLAVSAGDARRSGLGQLARTLAALWVEGHEPDWARFESGVPVPSLRSARVGSCRSDPPAGPPPVPLRLGAPLVKLDGSAPALAGAFAGAPAGAAPAAWTPAGGRPDPDAARLPGGIGDRLAAVHDEVVRASADVARALGTRSHVATRRAAVAPAAAPPAIAEPPAPVAPAAAAAGTSRPLPVSTASMPWIGDHCFYRQADGWPDERDRFPVVPMTTMVELMVDEVARVVPDRQVVALRSVRALRWLPAAPAHEVTIRTGPVEGDEVRVSIDGHARAVAVLADEFPEPTGARLGPLTDPRPSERTARAMYDERMMFHGPAYQGVTALGCVGADGIDGTLSSLAAPGGLLDSTGQLMGYWMMLAAETDRLALPVSIDEIAFSGPRPPVGTAVDARVRITHVDPGKVRADHELDVGGRVWCRIRGWEDRRFQTDEVLWALFVHPEVSLASEARPGGWELVTERWPDAATRELILRRYTTAAERAEHDALTPRAQRTWLLGRVAAKDAVRRPLVDGGRPTYPAEVSITHDASGAPVARGPAGRTTPRVSIAHLDGVAVAIACTDGSVGIDIVAVPEPGEPVTRHLVDLALTGEEERRLPVDDGERAVTLARWWAAKEAAGKAGGAGLGGRPRALPVTEDDGTRLRVGDVRIETATVDVGGRPHVVAWTTGDDR